MSYSLDQFASTIRSKTGNHYKNLDDKELVDYWLTRYPGDKQFLSSAGATQKNDLGFKDYVGQIGRPDEVTGLVGEVWHKLKSGAVQAPAGMSGILASLIDPFKVESGYQRDIAQGEAYLSNPDNIQYNDINNRPEGKEGLNWDFKASQYRIKKEQLDKSLPEMRDKLSKLQEYKETPEGERKRQAYESVAGVTKDLHEWGKAHVDEWISTDEKLRGMLAWQEQNPYDFGLMLAHPSTWGRGVADLLPSILSMYIPGRAFKLVGGTSKMLGNLGNNRFAKGLTSTGQFATKAGDVLDKYSLGTMMALEGGDQFDRTYNYLTEELGMDPLDAISVAGSTTSIYAPLSGILERFQVKKAAKYLGIEKNVEKAFLTRMANRLIKGANFKNTPKSTGLGRGMSHVSNVLDFGVNAIEEGFVEGWQAGTGLIIDEAIKLGYGPDSPSAMYHLHQNMMSVLQDEGLNVLIPPMSSHKEIKGGFLSAMMGTSALGGAGSTVGITSRAFLRWKSGQGNKEVDVDGSEVKLKTNGRTEAVIPTGSAEEAKRTAQQIKRDESSKNNPVGVTSLIKTLEDYAIETVNQLAGGRNQGEALDPKDVKGFFNTLDPDTKAILSYNPNTDEQLIGKRLTQIIKASKDPQFFKKLGLTKDQMDAVQAEIATYTRQSEKDSYLDELKGTKKEKLNTISSQYDEAIGTLSDNQIVEAVASDTAKSLMNGVLPDALIDKKLKEEVEKGIKTAEQMINIPTSTQERQIEDQLLNSIAEEFESRIANKDTSVLKSKNLNTQDRIAVLASSIIRNGIDNTIKLLTDPMQINATVLKSLAEDLGSNYKLKFKKSDYQNNKKQVAEAIVNTISGAFNLVEDATPTFQEESFTGEVDTIETAPRPPVKKEVPDTDVESVEVDKDYQVPANIGLIKRTSRAEDGTITVRVELQEEQEQWLDDDGNRLTRKDFNSDKEYEQFLSMTEDFDSQRQKGKEFLANLKKEVPVKETVKKVEKGPPAPPLKGEAPSDEYLEYMLGGEGGLTDEQMNALESKMLNDTKNDEKVEDDANNLTDDIADDLCL